MNHFDRLQSFVELCHNHTASVESMEAGFRTHTEEMGLRHYACCSHVDPLEHPNHAVMLHNYPVAWVQHFSEAKLNRIDPVLQLAESRTTPFYWDDAFSSHPLTEAQKKVLSEAAKHGLEHGYTIPITLSWIPGSLRASCSVVPDSVTISPRSYVTAELMALSIYAAVSRVRTPRSTMISIELTPRERQCLALAAQGKDDWSIGELLSMSQHTAHSHIERIKQRFGVCTRAQAVLQGFMTGQISVGDVTRR